MKRITALLLAVVTLLSMTACTNKKEEAVKAAQENMWAQIELANEVNLLYSLSDQYDKDTDTYHFIATLNYDAMYDYVIGQGNDDFIAKATSNIVQSNYKKGEDTFEIWTAYQTSIESAFAECEGTTIVLDIVGFDGSVIASFIDGKFQGESYSGDAEVAEE